LSDYGCPSEVTKNNPLKKHIFSSNNGKFLSLETISIFVTSPSSGFSLEKITFEIHENFWRKYFSNFSRSKSGAHCSALFSLKEISVFLKSNDCEVKYCRVRLRY